MRTQQKAETYARVILYSKGRRRRLKIFYFHFKPQQVSFFLLLSEEFLSASCYILHNTGENWIYIYCFNIESLVHPFLAFFPEQRNACIIIDKNDIW